MATWHIEKTRRNTIQLIYRDIAVGTHFDCGETSAQTPLKLIHEWIVNHSHPWDVISHWDGHVMPILPVSRGAA